MSGMRVGRNAKGFIEKKCPLLFAELENIPIPGDTPLSKVFEYINKIAERIGCGPIEGSDSVEDSSMRIEKALSDMR